MAETILEKQARRRKGFTDAQRKEACRRFINAGSASTINIEPAITPPAQPEPYEFGRWCEHAVDDGAPVKLVKRFSKIPPTPPEKGLGCTACNHTGQREIVNGRMMFGQGAACMHCTFGLKPTAVDIARTALAAAAVKAPTLPGCDECNWTGTAGVSVEGVPRFGYRMDPPCRHCKTKEST